MLWRQRKSHSHHSLMVKAAKEKPATMGVEHRVPFHLRVPKLVFVFIYHNWYNKMY
jgi:hypothetical protein